MKIAIKGHESRGKEVIQILESLGGVNKCSLTGREEISYYYIDYNYNNIIHCHDNKYVNKYCKKYTLEEFEKEFPFKVGDEIRDCSDDEVGIITDLLFIGNMLMYNVDFVNSGQAFMPTEQLKLYKEMKERRNIILTLEKAKEWYKKGGELKEIALQAFTEKELNPLPRSWAEFCINHPVKFGETYIGTCSKFISRSVETRDSVYDRYVCPSRKSAEAHLAMIQLEQLRDCWRQGWIPKTHEPVYTIKFSVNGLSVYLFNSRAFLSFPTKEMAEEFLKCFRDLIEKAGDLI